MERQIKYHLACVFSDARCHLGVASVFSAPILLRLIVEPVDDMEEDLVGLGGISCIVPGIDYASVVVHPDIPLENCLSCIQ